MELYDVGGRSAKLATVEIRPGLDVKVLEAADPEEMLLLSIQTPADPYAGVLWPAAIAAARAMADELRPGETALELGAGTGLCSLTAARLGHRAIALDYDRFALGLIRKAAELQEVDVDVRRFDLYDKASLPAAEVVVIADLLYEQSLSEVAAHRAIEAVRRGSRVLIGDPGRFGRPVFEYVLEQEGMKVDFRTTYARLPKDEFDTLVGVARMEAVQS